MWYVECTADGVGQCVYCAAPLPPLWETPFFSKTYTFYFTNPTFYRFILLKLKASLVRPRAKQGKFPHILL